MEKLNELVELVKEYNSATTAEEALAINNQFKATANRETIIAIAKAYRALEQRASNLNDGWLNAIAERDEARAKLAELVPPERNKWEGTDEEGYDIDYMEPSDIYQMGKDEGFNLCRAAILRNIEEAKK